MIIGRNVKIRSLLDKEYYKNKLLSKRQIDPITGCWNWMGSKNSYGYGVVYRNKSPLTVHRLSAMIWLRFDLNSKLFVLHKCDNRKCFNPDHLFIGTQKDNMKDKTNKGRQIKGEECHTSKLIVEDVIEMRDYWKNKEFSKKDLADIYKVSYEHICDIIRRKYWKHI